MIKRGQSLRGRWGEIIRGKPELISDPLAYMVSYDEALTVAANELTAAQTVQRYIRFRFKLKRLDRERRGQPTDCDPSAVAAGCQGVDEEEEWEEECSDRVRLVQPRPRRAVVPPPMARQPLMQPPQSVVLCLGPHSEMKLQLARHLARRTGGSVLTLTELVAAEMSRDTEKRQAIREHTEKAGVVPPKLCAALACARSPAPDRLLPPRLLPLPLWPLLSSLP